MKNKKNLKQIIILVLIFLAVAFGISATVFSVIQKDSKQDHTISELTGNLIITNLDVGKADAAFIEYNGLCGIIDTGTKDNFSTLKSYMNDNNRQDIDFMIITHYDKDHVGGAVKLLQKYNVKKLYLPDYVSSKAGYSKLMEELDGNNSVDHEYVTDIVTITKDDLTIEIIPSTDPEALIADPDNMDNNMSLLTMLTLRNKKFLFTGDIEKDRIAQILNSGKDIKADWIKIPHHGGYEDNSEEFLRAVSPEYSVVSTGFEKPTDNKLLAILAQLNISNYSTIGGDIITISNGNEIEVKYLE